MDELELEATINIQKLGYEFLDKPVIVGGLAMEYYGLRKHSDDIDFIVTNRDYQRLKVKFPDHRKDVWGDFGLLVNDFELFRRIYRFDHAYYSLGAISIGIFLPKTGSSLESVTMMRTRTGSIQI